MDLDRWILCGMLIRDKGVIVISGVIKGGVSIFGLAIIG